MLIYVIIAIIILFIIYLVILFNKFTKLSNEVKEAFSTMDVYLKKRWDLIPNIVQIVKEYEKYEKETLSEIVELRNNTYDAMNNNEKVLTNEDLEKKLPKIIILIESYPNLKANKNFKDLHKQLKIVEDEIAKSRKYYNGITKIYNEKISLFPNFIFANIFGFKKVKMFEANYYEKNNINIDL